MRKASDQLLGHGELEPTVPELWQRFDASPTSAVRRPLAIYFEIEV
jgi:hypothetical protein